ncbi:hypothetical protein CWR48_16555 [Oceanobacillus arenosus]|uniref:DUF2642 domain-containing protein n=1 Tax=Oceanobacillus arenosus TaxID=1229153 RepID=A0A3D8PLF6_9BACI|nr:hypothetical protein [Oceanobacillus arenosus]RDW16492.1 hypothetical protein CWR48_16555 [Oceanobacillus arenosus]
MNERNSFLNHLIGFNIKVVYPGPHTLKGLLAGIKEDYLILKDDKDVIQYVKLDKMKELTKNTKDIKPRSIEDIPVSNHRNFLELLKEFENEWLMVSRDGAEEIQGFLSNVSNSYITFVVKDEITFIPISQIAMLSSKLGKKPTEKHPTKSDNQSNGNNDNKETKPKQPEKEAQPIRFNKGSNQDESKNPNAETQKREVKINTNEVQVKTSKEKTEEKSNHSLDEFLKPSGSNTTKNRTLSPRIRQPESMVREEKEHVATYRSSNNARSNSRNYS